MKVEWKKLMFGLAIGAGMMMMASCSDEENFDPGGSTGKETPEPTEKAFLSMRLSTGSLAGTRVAVDPTTSGRTEEQVVNHVRMVLYETKNNTVRYSWDLNVSIYRRRCSERRRCAIGYADCESFCYSRS